MLKLLFIKQKEYKLLLIIAILELSIFKEGGNKYVGNLWKSIILWDR